jgi:hypothetical protein
MRRSGVVPGGVDGGRIYGGEKREALEAICRRLGGRGAGFLQPVLDAPFSINPNCSFWLGHLSSQVILEIAMATGARVIATVMASSRHHNDKYSPHRDGFDTSLRHRDGEVASQISHHLEHTIVTST